jgi:ketosteroid isomerase-like protein
MSEENVEVVREWFERWNRHERWFLEHEVHPDMQVVSRIQNEPFRGRGGLRRWIQEIDEQFQEWELIVDEWRDVGDLVVGLGRIRLLGRESGVGFDQPAGWLLEIKDGKLFRLQNFVRPEEALEAAGLSE